MSLKSLIKLQLGANLYLDRHVVINVVQNVMSFINFKLSAVLRITCINNDSAW